MYIEKGGWVKAKIIQVSRNNLQVYKVQFLICLFKLPSVTLSRVITAKIIFLCFKLLYTDIPGIVFAQEQSYIT